MENCKFCRIICLENFKNGRIICLENFKFVSLQSENQDVSMYYKRIIDTYLSDWAKKTDRKPVLLRGARQVGKSSAVRNLGKEFEYFVEVNFEKQPDFKKIFIQDLDVVRICSQIAAICGKPVYPGKTLLFLDEIQICPEAIMSLRFFKEDLPGLHVVAAGSLLEFALDELPTFGVGRIHSMFMYPMTFDEFLSANSGQLLMQARDKSAGTPLAQVLHDKLVGLLRTYMLVGGMPEVVAKWVETKDYIQCQELQDDIIQSFEDDFPKYRKRVDPLLLRLTLRSAAVQNSKKFVYSSISQDHKIYEIKKAVDLLVRAGLLVPVMRTNANGLPLGSEADNAYLKMLLLDTGLMLRLLDMASGDISGISANILTGNTIDLVNKGTVAEQLAGLEMLKYSSPNLRHELFYWQRLSKNAIAEVDYLLVDNQRIIPVEVKAGTQGGMKSLWAFMRGKNLSEAVRCSLENFGKYDYVDEECGGHIRHVHVIPLYAVSCFKSIIGKG